MKNESQLGREVTLRTAFEQGSSALGNYFLLFTTIVFLNIEEIPLAGLYTSANLVVVSLARSTLSSVLVSEITSRNEYPEFFRNIKWYILVTCCGIIPIAILKVLDYVHFVFLFSLLLVPIGEMLRTMWLASNQLNRLLKTNVFLISLAFCTTFIINSRNELDFTSLLLIWVAFNTCQVLFYLTYFSIDWFSARGEIFRSSFSSAGLTLGFFGGLIPHIASVIITFIMSFLDHDFVRGEQLLIATFFLPLGFFLNFQFNRILANDGDPSKLKEIWGRNFLFSALLTACTIVFIVFRREVFTSLNLSGSLLITILTVVVSYLSIKLQINILVEGRYRAAFGIKVLWLITITASSFVFGIYGNLLIFTLGLFLTEGITFLVSYRIFKRYCLTPRTVGRD